MTHSKHVHDVNKDNFDALVLQASYQTPVLLDFWAPWCGPCQALSPILDKLAEEYGGKFTVAKVNTDEEQMIAGQFGIRSLPTVQVVREGRIVDGFTGAQPEGAIRQLIDRLVTKPSDRVLEQARAALSAGKTDRAVALLRQAADKEPDNAEIKLELAAALLQTGDADQVRQILDSLPAAERESEPAKALASRLEFIDAIADAPDVKTLIRRLETAPDDLKARHQFGVRKLLAGEYETALEQFLEIMKRNRQFENDLGRRSLLAAFKIVDDPKLINRYRQRMAAFLF